MFASIFSRASYCSQRVAVVLLLMWSATAMSCHDLTGNQSLPSGIQDPSYYNNASGALGMRNTAISEFGDALPNYLIVTGLLTDELTDPTTVTGILAGGSTGNSTISDPLDERILPELAYGASGSYASDFTYASLQGNRTTLLQAIGQLATYDSSARDSVILKPSVGRVMRGELYALYGYTEIMLADFFCSGIPLSTLDFQKDFTYKSGDSTSQVYRDAIAKFDTALVLSADSVRLEYLARIGLARAYLDLGNFAAAADDVSVVPTDYQYQYTRNFRSTSLDCAGAYCNIISSSATAADREGVNGLPYLSSGDPRTADTTISVSANEQTYLANYPKLYLSALTGDGKAPIMVASGVEAQLIQAEEAIHIHDPSWLTILNTLRTSGTVIGTYTRLCQNGIQDDLGNIVQMGSPCPAGVVDTTWSPGTGIGLIPAAVLADAGPSCPASPAPGTPCTDTVWYKGLRPLTDPGNDSARIALLFRERAAWLYLSGHRQGDLRRQLRTYPQYWPFQSDVYPSGLYLGAGQGTYGIDVTAPIPANEYINPLFHGCINRAP